MGQLDKIALEAGTGSAEREGKRHDGKRKPSKASSSTSAEETVKLFSSCFCVSAAIFHQ